MPIAAGEIRPLLRRPRYPRHRAELGKQVPRQSARPAGGSGRAMPRLARHHVGVPDVGIAVEEEQRQLVVLISVHVEGPRVCRWGFRSLGVSGRRRGTALHSGPDCQRESDDLSAFIVGQLPGSRAGDAQRNDVGTCGGGGRAGGSGWREKRDDGDRLVAVGAGRQRASVTVTGIFGQSSNSSPSAACSLVSTLSPQRVLSATQSVA